MSDAPGPGAQGQQPSEEEVRAYLGQLRAAPAEQVIAEVLQGLLNAAQVKLGRRDARLLIDLSASVVDQARAHLSANLTQQVDEALSQLRMGQVEAEKEVAQASQQGHEEPNDLGAQAGGQAAPSGAGGQTAAPGEGSQASPSGQQPPPQPPPQQRPASDPASRLWIPGR